MSECPFSRLNPSPGFALLLIAAVLATAPIANGVTATFRPYKDNTLIESSTGALSNGLGDGIFCGRLGTSGDSMRLRAVLAFDTSSIPVGSTVTSASLRMWLVQGHGGNQTCSLYRLLGNWGEGTYVNNGGNGAPATANDATWIHKFYPGTLWTTPGGNFSSTSSASATVGNSGNQTWSSAGVIADVQYWINNPANNFGWIVRGNETTLSTAKKWVSRNWTDQSESPLLTVTYTPPAPPPCTADINHDGTVNSADLLAVINAWGRCPAQPAPCPADIAPAVANGVVDVNDLLFVINKWGPCPTS